MKSVIYVLKETFRLVRKHKFYFLLPILVALALLTFLAYQVGPAAAVSFIYTGL